MQCLVDDLDRKLEPIGNQLPVEAPRSPAASASNPLAADTSISVAAIFVATELVDNIRLHSWIVVFPFSATTLPSIQVRNTCKLSSESTSMKSAASPTFTRPTGKLVVFDRSDARLPAVRRTSQSRAPRLGALID